MTDGEKNEIICIDTNQSDLDGLAYSKGDVFVQ